MLLCITPTHLFYMRLLSVGSRHMFALLMLVASAGYTHAVHAATEPSDERSSSTLHMPSAGHRAQDHHKAGGHDEHHKEDHEADHEDGHQDQHVEQHQDEHHHGHEQNSTRLDPAIAQEVGITTATAGPGELVKTTTVYGRVATPPENISRVQARFSGVVTEVNVNLGESVNAGDLLALIESDDSLRVYELRAPIKGVITARHANTGERTLDQVLFTITNLDRVWAQLKVFPNQLNKVAIGNPVIVAATGADIRQQSKLRHLIPSPNEQPFAIAHADLDNPQQLWTPGMMVAGNIQTSSRDADIVVPNRALQQLDGETVVFVVEDGEFVARPVETGERDYANTEIIAGLQSGETYVVDNSYLIKADIEKAGAEHHH